MVQQDIQSCIDQCTKTAQVIRGIANEMVDHRARLALSEAGMYVEECIHDCLDAKELAAKL